MTTSNPAKTSNTQTEKKKFRRADILLVGGLIVVFIIFGAFYLMTRSAGDQVVVRVSGEQTAAYTINDTVDTVIEGKNGGTNRLIIKDGKVWVQDASCPDKLCEGMGKISSSGESIICLPNEVVVEIHGEKSDDVDTVAK